MRNLHFLPEKRQRPGAPTIDAAGRLVLLLVVLISPKWSTAGSLRETIESVQPRVVKVFGAGGVRNLPAYGTGFLVSPEGHIATVWSHVLYEGDVLVVLHDGRRFSAEVLGAEPQLDMAVLKINAPDLALSHFDVDRTATADAGTRVLGFSNAFQVAAGDEDLSVLHGVVAAQTDLTARRGTFETTYAGPVYIVDAITNSPGAAGGALTTWDGRLLGMIGKELRQSESNTWVNYAIPMTEARDVLKQIISGRYESQPVDTKSDENPGRYIPLDFGLVMIPDVVERTPPYIDDVLPDSAAAQRDFRPGDLIVFLNDRLIPSCRTLQTELGRLEPGDTLRLVIRRGNRLITAENIAVRP